MMTTSARICPSVRFPGVPHGVHINAGDTRHVEGLRTREPWIRSRMAQAIERHALSHACALSERGAGVSVTAVSYPRRLAPELHGLVAAAAGECFPVG